MLYWLWFFNFLASTVKANLNGDMRKSTRDFLHISKISVIFSTYLWLLYYRVLISLWISWFMPCIVYFMKAQAFHDVDLRVNSCSYPYLAVVLNFSQTWALYCLVQFYSVTKNKLAPIKPLAKFLVFKSIVFLTWWQGIAVAFLLSFGTFKGSLVQLLKTRIQDYIICIEVSCVFWISFVHWS